MKFRMGGCSSQNRFKLTDRIIKTIFSMKTQIDDDVDDDMSHGCDGGPKVGTAALKPRD